MVRTSPPDVTFDRSPADRFSLDSSDDRLAWIFGSSRSGSTWLLRMLSSLEGVVPIDDPHLGHHLGVWRPISLAWATAEHPPRLTTLDRVKHDKDGYVFSDRYRDAWEPALTPAEHDVMHEIKGPKLAELGYLEPDPIGLA